ncbi:MAG TPA: agmatinase family protein [Solirubrobacterales bacterium]|nr:agmatinase family protein [Solirubrobacterales bacterium]
MTSSSQTQTDFAAIASGVISFLGAPHVPVERIAERAPGAAFLGVPFEGGNAAIERPGSANGPRALRIASNMCFPWSFEWDIDLFDAYDLVDCGDSPVAVGNAEATHALVEERIHAILAAGTIPIAIGGDHSLCIPGARALSRHLGPERKMGYIQIDAHLDAGPELGGQASTNCSGLVRASELPNLAVENMAVIGVRGTINVPAWWEEVRERGIPVHPMSQLRREGVIETVRTVLDRVWDGVDGVYVTLDTDSIDSAAAPGTTGPEPGGFTSHEIIEISQMIGERGLTAVDNVELAPVYDPSGITARLIWEALSQMLYANAKHHG